MNITIDCDSANITHSYNKIINAGLYGVDSDSILKELDKSDIINYICNDSDYKILTEILCNYSIDSIVKYSGMSIDDVFDYFGYSEIEQKIRE